MTSDESSSSPPPTPSRAPHPQGNEDRERASSEDTEPSTPHDGLFHIAFERPEHAAAELRCALPPALSAKINWRKLKAEPGRFVDAQLATRQSDLLFSAPIGRRRALIYLLFEHVSSRKPMELLKVLEYMVRIWRAYVKTHPRAKHLPFILPVVLHHSEAGWTVARRFRDLLDIDPEVVEALEPFIPDFHVLLDDISRVDPSKIKQRPMTPEGKLVLFCFRVGRSPDEFVRWLPEWADVLVAVSKAPNGGLLISSVIKYLEKVTRLGEAGLKMALQQSLGKNEADDVYFAGQRLLERGRREGEFAGQLAGQRALLLRQLGARFGELPSSAIARVQAATTNELEEMAVRILGATTLAQVIGKKKRR